MIDLGNCYFCCDECPIIEGLEHRLRIAEEYGELQLEYCGCDKTEYEFFLGGFCSDAILKKIADKKSGRRKTGSRYRREMKRRKFERYKELGWFSRGAGMGYVDWEYVNGRLLPVGRYFRYPKDSHRQRFYKRHSNKRVRKTAVPLNGSGYKRCFDYRWEID